MRREALPAGERAPRNAVVVTLQWRDKDAAASQGGFSHQRPRPFSSSAAQHVRRRRGVGPLCRALLRKLAHARQNGF